MTNYSVNPGHVRIDFFKESGKWYMTEVLDMSKDYDTGITPKDAVISAMRRTERHDALLNNKDFHIVVLEPYHKSAYPVMFPTGN